MTGRESDTPDSRPDEVSERNRPLTSQSDTSDTSDSSTDDELLEGVRDGAWLNDEEFPPLRYAIRGLVPEGLSLLVGPPKAGKSWLILDLLLSVAAGGVALGHIRSGDPRRVFYLALEDGDRRMQDRCRALLGDDQDIPLLFHYKTRVPPGKILATVAAFLRRHPDTVLIAIDTLGKVMPPAMVGESAYQRDYRIASALKALTDTHPGLSMAVLHHDRKAISDDFVDSVSGTHGLAGAADTIIVLCRRRQSTEASLKVTGRDVPENEYALNFTDGKAWQLAGPNLASAAAEAAQRASVRSLSDTSADVLKYVAEHPEGVRAKDVVEKFGKDAYQILKRLTEYGRIDKAARGFYVPTVSEPSEVSETQVSGIAETDTHLLLLSEVSETRDGEENP